jgi:HEAT repeat protein
MMGKSKNRQTKPKEESYSKSENSGQTVKAEGGSTISNVGQSTISGDIINSLVATAGGNLIINYVDGQHELFDRSMVYQQFLTTIVSHERFSRWADEHYINETGRPLPMNIAPYDINLLERKIGPRRNLIEVVEEYFSRGDGILILGEPGSGKTTALERLVYLYARRGLDNIVTPLPLLIPLNRYDGNLIHAFRAALNELGGLELSEKQTELLLTNIQSLILFDGLNELGGLREGGIRAIQNFMDTYPQHRYALTCRTQDFHNDLEVKQAWEVQPIDERDVEHYLQTHLGDEGRDLYDHLHRDERMLGLARNPLMLRMIKDASAGGRLPRNRGELYRDFVKKMLWREGQKGIRAHSVPPQVKERALAQLGYKMQKEKILYSQEHHIRDSFIRYLQEWSEPYNWRDLLLEIRLNGLLTPTGSGWTFMHQSLQEFFAAYALEEAGLSDDALDDVIGNPDWNEVLVLLSGITKQSSRLVRRLLSSNPFLAVKSISQGATPDHEVLQAVIDKLGNMSRSENWTVRRTCADLMGEIASPLAYLYLTELLKDSNAEVRWGAVHSIRLIGVRDKVVQALLPLTSDSFWVTQGEAAMTLGELKAIEAIPQLESLLASDSAYIRISATYALVKLAFSTSSLEAEKLLNSTSERVRILAHFATQVVHRQDQTEFMIESLKNGLSLVREASVMLLTRANEYHAAFEIAILLEDSDSQVRAMAVTALGKLQAREFVSQIVHSMLEDSDAFVRESAAGALELMHAYDVFPHFLSAAKDESPGVRFVVARSLGRLHITQARPVLKELAYNDPSNKVRLHAIRSLGYMANQEDVQFLENLSIRETDPEVVQSIQEAIDNFSKGDRSLRF